MKYKYIGCFFDLEESRALRRLSRFRGLKKRIKSLHVTIEYDPEEVDTDLFGEEIEVRVTGYGNNRRNEGLLVEAHSDNPVIQAMLDRIEVQHITLSRALAAESVDTKNLEFRKIKPLTVKGRFGGFSEELGPIVGINK